jgi:hypothetical protein
LSPKCKNSLKKENKKEKIIKAFIICALFAFYGCNEKDMKKAL